MLKKSKVIVLMAVFALVMCFVPNMTAKAATNWNFVWGDEFDQPLSSSNWVYDIGTGSSGWGNNELQYYTNRTQNLNVTGGNLEITALKEAYGGMNYTSARIKSKDLKQFTHGKIEARMKLPSGQGLLPAFWMLGSNIDAVGWPVCGEIDIMERRSNDPFVNGTAHWDSNGHASFGKTSANVDFSQFHTYSIEWDASYIRWFVDGVQYNEFLIANGVGNTQAFQKPFFILLNMAVGGNWPGSPDASTQFPAKMYVDYVHVYSAVDAPVVTSKPNFMIVSKFDGKALDLISGNTTNGAPINQWSYDANSTNQKWSIEPSGNGHFKIISAVTGKALCIEGPSLADGAQIHDWDYTGVGTDQQWDLINVTNGWYEIRNVYSGKALDIAGYSTTDGSKVQQWTYGGTDNQLWRLQLSGDYNIKADSGKYICVQGSGSSNGNAIIQYDFQNNPWFKWRLEDAGDGFAKVSSLNALGRVLCVDTASTVPGHWCQLWDYNSNNIGDQKVRIEPQLDGKFKFYFAHDGQSFDIPAGQTGNNVPLDQYTPTSNSWQEFTLEKAQ